MPTKEYLQQLQRVFAHFKRNGGRNVPAGVTQIALVDDDDLTRWFVQLLYRDENKSDFHVSLELVFTEDGDADEGGGSDGTPADVVRRRTAPSPFPHPSASPLPPSQQQQTPTPREVSPTPGTIQMNASVPPQRIAIPSATSQSPLHPQGRTTTSSSTAPLPLLSSSVSLSRRWDGNAEDEENAIVEAVVRNGSQTPLCHDTIGSPTAITTTTPPPPHTDVTPLRMAITSSGDEEERQPLPRAVEGEVENTAAGAAAAAGDGRTGQRRQPLTRMPLVFVVAPRLVASFIHHGALCSLELMSQRWEFKPETLTLLLIALHETLNPFAGDGRVSVDDPERVESRREAVVAAGGHSGPAAFAGAYTGEEHELGLAYIRRAHPHLFRRYVGPSGVAAHAAEPQLGQDDRAPTSLAPDATRATVSNVSDSVDSHDAQPATTFPSTIEAAATQTLSCISHLNTAVYDALVLAHAASLSSAAAAAAPPPPLQLLLPPSPDQPNTFLSSSTATAAPVAFSVVMRLDTPALLADANAERRLEVGVRGVQQVAQAREMQEEGKSDNVTSKERRDFVNGDAAAERGRTPSPPPPSSLSPSSSVSTPPATRPSVFAPFQNAERVLRTRPPALSHLVHAPLLHDSAAEANLKDRVQRVAELWIPFALPPSSTLPAAAAGTAGVAAAAAVGVSAATPHAGGAGRGGVAEVLLEERQGDATTPQPLEVLLVGDAVESKSGAEDAPVACVLRNIRVLTNATRAARASSNGGGGGYISPTIVPTSTSAAAAAAAASSIRFSLQPSTAPTPAGEVHTCHLPAGLTLHCRHLYLYGHLHILGHLILDHCVFVGSLVAEGFATVRVTHSRLALTPDDRLLRPLAAPPGCPAPPSCRRNHDGSDRSPVASSGDAPRPPTLCYAARKEGLLVLDSSRVEMEDETRVCRLGPAGPTGVTPVSTQRRGSHHHDCRQARGEASGSSSRREEEMKKEAGVSETPQPPAVLRTMLRSLILVSNQGRLRLVRCTLHPGHHTERTIFAEQDAIVDMAYCTVTAAISSAVSLQGCRAHLEHCRIRGDAPSATATRPMGAAGAAAEGDRPANEGGDNDSDRDDESARHGEGNAGSGDRVAPQWRQRHRRRSPQQHQPHLLDVHDAVRRTGLNVELGGTLSARFCEVQHLYFAFCVIAHSVAHLYRCHAEDVVNGYTVDASAATLDCCSANTNHVGVFVLRKGKCFLMDDSCGGYGQRCLLLGEAYREARSTVAAEMRARSCSQGPSSSSSLDTAAECTARVAALARQFYAAHLHHRPDTATDMDAATSTVRAVGVGAGDAPLPPLGFVGGRFSLEVRDAALTATGLTLLHARDTALYAYEDSVVELAECVLWSTAEVTAASRDATAPSAIPCASRPMEESALHHGSWGPHRHSNDSVDGFASAVSSAAPPRPHRCGVKVVHATLKARQCVVAGYSFGIAAIQQAQAELRECLVTSALNGYTIDNSQCVLRHCGADTSHVGLFALQHARVVVESTPHVVGVGASGRTPPPRICGGVPAAFSGDVYGMESQASELTCTGVTVLRGRDSGVNAYGGSVLRLRQCLVAMSPNDAATYVFHQPPRARSAGDGRHAATAEEMERCSSRRKRDADGWWTRHLKPIDFDEVEWPSSITTVSHHHHQQQQHERDRDETKHVSRAFATAATATTATVRSRSGGGDSGGADADGCPGDPAVLRASASREDNKGEGEKERGTDRYDADGDGCTDIGRGSVTNQIATAMSVAPPPPPPPLLASSARTTGVKVWSGSRCIALETEVRYATFGFASLGPGAVLEALHCTAKYVINGFTADGASLQLTRCSARTRHVGVFLLSHACGVVERGFYAAKKYGIECRGSVLTLRGHVKVIGFSRIGMYLYNGAHCEADPDCVLEVHAQKDSTPNMAVLSSSSLPTTATPPPPSPLDGFVDVTILSDLLPACIALEEAVLHLPQAVLGGGARCGITCGDGATAFIGQSIIHNCTLVGVNVFGRAHVTLINSCLQCPRQYAVIVHAGGVCRLLGQGEAEEDFDRAAAGGVDTPSTANDVRHNGTGSGGAAARQLLLRVRHAVTRPWHAIRGWGSGSTDAPESTTRHPVPCDTCGTVGAAEERAATDACCVCEEEEEEERSEESPLITPHTASELRRRKWLRWDTYRNMWLAFRMNALLSSGATLRGNPPSLRDSNSPTREHVSEGEALVEVVDDPTACVNRSVPVRSAFPPHQPIICGCCVIRGVCSMERVLLQPHHHRPRLRTDTEHDHDRVGGGVVDNENSAATPEDADADPHTATRGTGDVTAELPTTQVLLELMHQPPAVHVSQHGDLTLTDCLVDVSLAVQQCLGRQWYGKDLATAVMRCEGPNAMIQLDHVRALRGSTDLAREKEEAEEERAGTGEDLSSATEGTTALLTATAARPEHDHGGATSPRPFQSSSPQSSSLFSCAPADVSPPLLALFHRPAAAPPACVAEAVNLSTVPLLLVSLADGAKSHLHMLGTSLDDWPYRTYAAESHNGAPEESRHEPSPSSVAAGLSGAASWTAASLLSSHNAGVMLCTAGSAVAHASYVNIAAILATTGSQLQLTQCTLRGTVPLVLRSGSSSSLVSCRVVSGARAGYTAAAIRVEDGSRASLQRSSVWTLSRGPAVECRSGGVVQATDCEEEAVWEGEVGGGGGGGAS